MEAEALYYTCCDRIDQDLEVAESFLVGCIAYIVRDRGEKGVREKIKDDLKFNCYEPYLRELRLISLMHDDSILALIASSIDLSHIEKCTEIILENVQYAKKELIQGSTHAGKAQRIIDNMAEISRYIRGTKKEINQPALFEEDTSWLE